ncbi:MAG: hypothetical protein ACK5NE_09375 [Brachymonas sp.]
MPVPSTSVKWMHSAMQGAPVLDNNWGDLTALLRACAVNGFNVKPIQAITCNGTTATVQCSGHGYLEHQVVKIEGADPAEYNGEHRIVSVVDTNTVTITLAAALAPATQAEGKTLQIKAAPLGFESLYDDAGQKLVLRSTNAQSPRNVLRVDNSCPTGYTTTYAKFGRVTMAQGMSDLDTFVGARAPYDPLLPTKNEVPSGSGTSVYGGWYKWLYSRNSDTSNGAYTTAQTAGARSWVVIGDDRGFYLMTGMTAGYTYRQIFCFSDFDSLQSPDTFATVLAAWDHYVIASTSNQAFVRVPLIRGGSTDGVVLMRDHTGGGENINASPLVLDVTGTSVFDSGAATSTVPYPNGPGNSLLLHPVLLQQSNGHIRGKLRGFLSVLHAHTLGDLATVNNVPGLPGRRVLLVNGIGKSGAQASVAFDITGPWGTA